MTVIIGQNSDNKSHTHEVIDPGHTHGVSVGNNTTYKGSVFNEIGTYSKSVNTEIKKTGISIEAAGGIEAKPLNITVKYFKRIN